jgi:hypothetical protein
MFDQTFIALWLATALYLWQAVAYYMAGGWQMAGVFVGYCIANVFMIAASARMLA